LWALARCAYSAKSSHLSVDCELLFLAKSLFESDLIVI